MIDTTALKIVSPDLPQIFLNCRVPKVLEFIYIMLTEYSRILTVQPAIKAQVAEKLLGMRLDRATFGKGVI